MNKFCKVNETLQSKTVDIGTVGALFDSLKDYVQELRNKFYEYALKDENLTKADSSGDGRARKRKAFFYEMPKYLKQQTTVVPAKKKFSNRCF